MASDIYGNSVHLYISIFIYVGEIFINKEVPFVNHIIFILRNEEYIYTLPKEIFQEYENDEIEYGINVFDRGLESP
jgi:hypothetical protein